MAVIDKVSVLDNFWLKELGGYFGKAAKVKGVIGKSYIYSRLISECVVFLEHVCKESPLEIRIRCISRTRVQSAASQQARHIEVLDFRNSGLGSRSFNT